MLQLRLEELFTPGLLKAFRERWGISPTDADRIAMRTVMLFQLKDKEEDADVKRRRKESWLKVMINALVGPEPDFEAWMEALATGNFEVRPNALYGRAKGKGQPALVLRRQRELIDGLISKEKLSPAEREDQRIAYLDAIRQIVVSVLLRELKDACSAKAAVGPAWPLVKAADHLTKQDLGQLRFFGSETGFERHLAKSMQEALSSWIAQNHDGKAPILTDVYSSKGLPPGVTRPDALKHLDRDNVAIERYRAKLSQALELDPSLPVRATTGANLDEIVEEDAATVRAALTVEEVGPYRFFTEANGGDERFEYDEDSRAGFQAILSILTGAGSEEQRAEAAKRARRRAELRKTRPGRMLDHELQEEINAYAVQQLPPPKGLTPENALYFEEEVCRVFGPEETWDRRWHNTGLSYPFWMPN